MQHHTRTVPIVFAFLLCVSFLAVPASAQDPHPASTADIDSIGFRPGPVSNFLIEISWPREGVDGVFVQRPYEIRITPRDRFLNPVDSLLRVRLTARYPGEFDASSRGYFQYTLELQGPRTLRLVSNTERLHREQLQWLRVYCEDSVHISGQSDPYSVLPHAPERFVLLWPEEDEDIQSILPLDQYTFSWERPDPPDPYADMRQTFEDSSLFADSVRYTCVITNAAQNQAFRLPADGNGFLPQRTLRGVDFLTYSRTLGTAELYWYVEATDGLYTTRSTPELSPFEISFSIDAAGDTPRPETAEMGVAFPNPFHGETTVTLRTAHRAHVRVTVHDLLGRTVCTLAEDNLAAGMHTLRWDGTDAYGHSVPTGLYLIRMMLDGSSRVRRVMHMH